MTRAEQVAAALLWAQRDASYGGITPSQAFHAVDNETLTLCGRHMILLDPKPNAPESLKCRACLRSIRRRGKDAIEILTRAEPQPEPGHVLPAPEVPEEVKVWAQTYDDAKGLGAGGAWITEADTAMRDWIRKEYGI